MIYELNTRARKLAFGGAVGFFEDELAGMSESRFEALMEAKLQQLKISFRNEWDGYKREEGR